MPHSVEILETDWVTHDVRRLKVAKPEGYRFEPGQATEVALDKEGWREEKRPFTFTSLNDWPELEFTIKVYPHGGVTEEVGKLKPGDRLLIDEPWGTIQYKGPGTFIAGGAGVTPFIAILRQLAADGALAGHRLIFSNKTERDIILREEFEAMEGLECLFTVTEQPDAPGPGVMSRFVDRDFLAEHLGDPKRHFYLCGPDKMVEDIRGHLKALGADPQALVFEE